MRSRTPICIISAHPITRTARSSRSSICLSVPQDSDGRIRPAAKLDKLEALMAETSAAKRDVALLADLLLLPTGRYADVEHNPRRRKEEIFEALQQQLTGLARKKPVLMIFEDLHWIDPTTQELLDLFIRRIDRLPVLLIATFRPDFMAPWADQPYVTMLTSQSSESSR